LRWLLVVGLALGLAGLGAWRLDVASGQGTVTRVVSPSTWPAGGGSFEVQIRIENVANLGSYEWQMTFDPALLEVNSVTDGPFLTSTGRAAACEFTAPPGRWQDLNGDTVPQEDEFILEMPAGNVRFGCASLGTAEGPSGSGVLSIVTLSPLAEGVSNLDLAWVSLSEPEASVDIPTQRQGSCVAIGASATCAIPTVAPPATPLPPVTATPGGPTEATPTPTGPLPTPTPTGPLPTPTPLPPGLEAVPLAAGCNPVASTYPDDTPIQTLANAVGPEGNLVSLWIFEAATWRAFSPQYPDVSDLTEADLLDVVFVCVGGPGAFVRPVV